MKRAILALLFVFAVLSVSAQTKKKSDKKVSTQSATTPPTTAPVQPAQSSPTYNFKFDLNILNIIIAALQNSQDIDAKTANVIVKGLITQANDSTLNKPIPIPKGQ